MNILLSRFKSELDGVKSNLFIIEIVVSWSRKRLKSFWRASHTHIWNEYSAVMLPGGLLTEARGEGITINGGVRTIKSIANIVGARGWCHQLVAGNRKPITHTKGG